MGRADRILAIFTASFACLWTPRAKRPELQGFQVVYSKFSMNDSFVKDTHHPKVTRISPMLGSHLEKCCLAWSSSGGLHQDQNTVSGRKSKIGRKYQWLFAYIRSLTNGSRKSGSPLKISAEIARCSSVLCRCAGRWQERLMSAMRCQVSNFCWSLFVCVGAG